MPVDDIIQSPYTSTATMSLTAVSYSEMPVCGSEVSPERANAVSQDEFPDPSDSARAVVNKYLLEHSEEFRRLQGLRKKGWQSTKGDEHFRKQRQSADNATTKSAFFFYNMMQKIADHLHEKTQAFSFRHLKVPPRILDMCMAPGGFVASVLKRHPKSIIKAMSLPPSQGGHQVLLDRNNLDVHFVDVTMLAGDIDIMKESIPASHPDAENFIMDKIFSKDEQFDLAFCDGQVLRTHERLEWRRNHEPRRLSKTQLAISLEHLKPGGTMVILLHKLEAWDTLHLIHTLSKFSDIQLYKHFKFHAIRSSFYAVAKNIQADSQLAKEAVMAWKQEWRIATFGSDDERREAFQAGDDDAQMLLDEFGEQLVVMGKPIWENQANALENASFIKSTDKRAHKKQD